MGWSPMDDGRIVIGRRCQRRGCGCKVAQWHSPGLLACIYCGAAQPLGPSNDGIPSDEALVARIISAVEFDGSPAEELRGLPVLFIFDFMLGLSHHRDGVVHWSEMTDVGATIRLAMHGDDDDGKERYQSARAELARRIIKGAALPVQSPGTRRDPRPRNASAQRDRGRPSKVHGMPDRARPRGKR